MIPYRKAAKKKKRKTAVYAKGAFVEKIQSGKDTANAEKTHSAKRRKIFSKDTKKFLIGKSP